jgi:hypothetical protein
MRWLDEAWIFAGQEVMTCDDLGLIIDLVEKWGVYSPEIR